MDQLKIGKFIAQRRKMINLTQAQLAEKLGITDRAVSKWERGIAMPDSSIMLELCGILEITVNDLLSGEVVTTMENYNKEMENKLVEVIKEKQECDRRLLTLELVIGIFSTVILLVPCILAAYLPIENWIRIVMIATAFPIAFVGFFFALRIEQVAGYYECAKCHHRYIPTFSAVNRSMHMGRTRYMKCPKCGEKSWQKKRLEKE